jgi:hypothetical protein
VDTDPYTVTATEQAAMSRRLETLVGVAGADRTVDLTLGTSSADDAVEARLAAIEDSLDGLAERLEALMRNAAADGSERFSRLESRLERLHAAVVEGFGTELASLRHDLADALDEVRDQVESTVGAANSTIAATLEAHGAAAHSVLEAVQAEVKSGLTEISRSLTGQFAAIRGVTGTLGGGTDRLVGAGQALLAYLGERDRWLERERDRVLHEVLDEFAEGLSGRGRRSLTSRMRNVVDRRRDARDAERFRQTEAETMVIDIPAIPPELAQLSEPLPDPLPDALPDPATDSFPNPAAPSPSESESVQLPVESGRPAQKPSPPSRSVPAKARAAKPAAAKPPLKRSATVQTGAKKAAAAKKSAAAGTGPSARNR